MGSSAAEATPAPVVSVTTATSVRIKHAQPPPLLRREDPFIEGILTNFSLGISVDDDARARKTNSA
jgi:hypothetical protein